MNAATEVVCVFFQISFLFLHCAKAPHLYSEK